jgi:hypothetical protein
MVVAAQLPNDNPVKKSALEYVTKYEAAHGKGSVSSFGGHAWDAGVLLNSAIPVALKKPSRVPSSSAAPCARRWKTPRTSPAPTASST